MLLRYFAAIATMSSAVNYSTTGSTCSVDAGEYERGSGTATMVVMEES